MTTTQNHFRIAALLILFAAIAAAQGSSPLQTTSMASYGPVVSPDSIAAIWGTGLSGTTTAAPSLPLGTTLSGVSVTITDSTGAKFSAPLFMVSPTQINIQVPANVALGKATVQLTSNTAANASTGTLYVSNVAPAIFTANGDGKGVPAAQILRINSAGMATYETPFTSMAPYSPAPIRLGSSGDKLYLILFATGIRRHSPNPVIALINGVSVPVLYAGPQSQFPGLDQVNIGPLPASLANAGLVSVSLLVDGVPSNTVQINIQ